ncbi:MBL fold metallo-hydrolase [Chelatococcus sp. GCM10030263]|uniref:MBL fold metallo-hydrolase n=1 Tax=Chelatococcus sp. GCM10030263 TaxID=3273387 RepID=UPI0036101F10
MRLKLYGGFGGKGVSVGLETARTRLIIDIGVNTSATGRDYYPAISAEELGQADALIVTHAHEDHVGGLGWCLAQGFGGRILMTPETRGDTEACLAAYAEPADRALVRDAVIETFAPGETLAIGDLTIRTGRNGHAVGGVWCAAEGEGHRVLHCGDIVPASAVFAYDAPPPSDVVLFDASYGSDDVPATQRAAAVVAWVDAHPQCLLPTPLAGRSLELMAILDRPLAIAAGMRDGLAAQIADERWLWPGVKEKLAQKLAHAQDWGGPGWPDRPLLAHDGMGLAGPSAEFLARAAKDAHPVLLTGHLPAGSPAEVMLAAGQAAWQRLPTHPTLAENIALLAAMKPRMSFGHSCTLAELGPIAARVLSLVATAVAGQTFEL